MASITKHIPAAAGAQKAWQMVSDIGGVDKLVGMISTCSLDGDKRYCTFADGNGVTEQIIGVDETEKRVVYTVTEGPMPIEFHCSTVQVKDAADGAEVVWSVDIKPDALAQPMSDLMDAAAQSMAERLAN